jgi:hypothetical protein
MTYFNDYYMIPFYNTLKRWKTWIYTSCIDITVILFLYYLIYFFFKLLIRYITPLENHNLLDYDTFILNINNYTQDINLFYTLLIFGSLILLLIIFLTYSFSRTLVWNKIHSIKGNFKRNILVHGIHFFTGFFIIIFCISFIQLDYYIHFLLISFLPWMYYTFFTSLNINKKKISIIFKDIKFYKIILFIPHTFIFILIALFLRNNLFLLFILLILFNLFRIYGYELLNDI